MPVTPADAAAIQSHVSTIQASKAALSQTLAALAPQFAEGEVRSLGDQAVTVVAKRDGVMKLETIPAMVDPA